VALLALVQSNVGFAEMSPMLSVLSLGAGNDAVEVLQPERILETLGSLGTMPF
jgi:hypothetical protein